eukprot:Clim_evm7s236 gene=Clim_evmTU7s236
MVLVHVVSFKFKEDTPQSTRDEIVAELRALIKLDAVLSMQVGHHDKSLSPSERSDGFHTCLVSTHENKEKLSEYSTHPEHQAVVAKIGPVAEKITALNYFDA